jgi:predicted HicB family RNase H-like nuclease
MKRIVNGVTYNTETSTRLARRRFQRSTEAEKLIETLYQTRGGAFFIVERRKTVQWDEREKESVDRVERTFRPASSDEARRWMLVGEVHVFRNPFGDPPEAAAEAEPGATIYIRVPATLKRDADNAAQKQKLSGNVWAMRCIESCLEGTSPFDVREITPLVQKLLDGDKKLAVLFQNAKTFWKDFFKKNSQRPVAAIAKGLGLEQHAFEAIFEEDYGRNFAKEMMPLTCLGSLYDEHVGFENRQLAKKVVEAFRESLVSIEIKGAHLKAATRLFPLD